MEALALVFLCSPSSLIRGLSLDLLQIIRATAHATFEFQFRQQMLFCEQELQPGARHSTTLSHVQIRVSASAPSVPESVLAGRSEIPTVSSSMTTVVSPAAQVAAGIMSPNMILSGAGSELAGASGGAPFPSLSSSSMWTTGWPPLGGTPSASDLSLTGFTTPFLQTPEIRVLDIFEQVGDNGVEAMLSDPLFMLNFDVPNHLPTPNFWQACTNHSAHMQLIWMYLYAEALRTVSALAPKVIASAWPILTEKLRLLTPEAIDKPFAAGDAENQTNHQLITWRNYMTFACAVANTNSGEMLPFVTRHILPFIRSTLPDMRLATSFALQRVQHDELCSAILRTLEEAPYSKSSLTVRRNRKRLEGWSLDLLQVYSSACSSLHLVSSPSTLEEQRAILVNFLVAMDDYFFRTPDDNFLADGRTRQRINFCHSVVWVARSLSLSSGANLGMDAAIRKKLFRNLLSWCRGDDDENFQRLLVLQEKDARNRRTYANDVQMREEVARVQTTACLAAAELLKGKNFHQSWNNSRGSLKWVDSMLKHRRKELREIGDQALSSFLLAYFRVFPREMMDTLFKHCYGCDIDLARGYFVALVGLCQTPEGLSFLPCDLPQIVALVIYAVASGSFLVRKNAIDLLQLLPLCSRRKRRGYRLAKHNRTSNRDDDGPIDLLTSSGSSSSTTIASPSPAAAAASAPSTQAQSAATTTTTTTTTNPALLSSEMFRLSQLIPAIDPEVDMRWECSYDPIWVLSDVADTHHRGQMILSARLARSHPDFSFAVINEVVSRLATAPVTRVPQMLRSILPWVCKIHLMHSLTFDTTPVVVQFLQNLMYVTQHFKGHLNLVEDLWHTLVATAEENVFPIIDFLAHLCGVIRNPLFLELAKKITLYVGRTRPVQTIEALVSELAAQKKKKAERRSPFAEVFRPPSSANVNKSDGQPLRPNWSLPQNLGQLLSFLPEDPSVKPILKTHLSIVLLSELSNQIVAEFKPHLAVVLHQLFMAFDFPEPCVFDHCRVLLVNIINSFVISPNSTSAAFSSASTITPRSPVPNAASTSANELSLSGGTGSGSAQSSSTEQLVASAVFEDVLELDHLLRERLPNPLWAREQVSVGQPIIRSSSEVENLVRLVKSALSTSQPSIAEEWASEALSWALSCPIAHLRCRSHQVYRALKSFGQDTLVFSEMVDSIRKLSRGSSHGNTYRQGVILETVHTLRTMVETLPASRLLLSNQIFWSAVALLNTDFSAVYSATVDLLLALVSRLSFTDHQVQGVLMAAAPRDWSPDFLGVVPLLMRGLVEPSLAPGTFHLLATIVALPGDEIFHPQNGGTPDTSSERLRFIVSFLACLPVVCLALETERHLESMHNNASQAGFGHRFHATSASLSTNSSTGRMVAEDEDGEASSSSSGGTPLTYRAPALGRPPTQARGIELLLSGAFRRAALGDLRPVELSRMPIRDKLMTPNTPDADKTHRRPYERCPHALKATIFDPAGELPPVVLPFRQATMLLSQDGVTRGSLRGLAPRTVKQKQLTASGFTNFLMESAQTGNNSDPDDADDMIVPEEEVSSKQQSDEEAGGPMPMDSSRPSRVIVGPVDVAVLTQTSPVQLDDVQASVIAFESVNLAILNLVAACEQLQLTELGTVLARFTQIGTRTLGVVHSVRSMKKFLDDVQRPFANAFGLTNFQFIFDVLFQLLDQSPDSYHTPLLKAISTFLQAYDDAEAVNARLRRRKEEWLSALTRCIGSPLCREAVEVADVIMQRSNLSFSHAETNTLKQLPSFCITTPFANQLGVGNRLLIDQLTSLLGKSRDHPAGGRSDMLAPPTFFTDMLNVGVERAALSDSEEFDLTDEAGEEEDTQGEPGTQGESELLQSSHASSDSTSDSDSDSYSYEESLHQSNIGAQSYGVRAMNVMTGFEDVFEQLPGDAEDDANLNTEVSFAGHSLNLTDLAFEREAMHAIVALYQFCSDERKGGEDYGVVEVLPLAWKALQQIRDDYQIRLDDFLGVLPQSDQKNLRPPLGANLLAYPIFNPPFDSRDDPRFLNVVQKWRFLLFSSLVSAKSLEGNIGRLFESFKSQLIEYLGLKVILERLLDDMLSGTAKNLTPTFIAHLIRLHHGLLSLYQIHIMLQAAVNDFAEGLVDDQKQSSVLAEDLALNQQVRSKYNLD